MMKIAAEQEAVMTNVEKMPPILEDLRDHTPQQMAELRLLLGAGHIGRPDLRRPGFYELDGAAHVYYLFRYPSGHKVLLLAAWVKQSDPVAELAALTFFAA